MKSAHSVGGLPPARPLAGNPDPAVWIPEDLSIVVVHPSALGSARVVGPSDDPRLAIVGDAVALLDADNTAAAVAQEMSAFTAPPSAPYLLLAAIASTYELVFGQRAPIDGREAALVSSLGAPEAIELVVATTRDDESPDSVERYSLLVPRGVFVEGTILAPAKPDPPSKCGAAPDASSRTGAWANTARARLPVEFYDEHCDVTWGIWGAATFSRPSSVEASRSVH